MPFEADVPVPALQEVVNTNGMPYFDQNQAVISADVNANVRMVDQVTSQYKRRKALRVVNAVTAGELASAKRRKFAVEYVAAKQEHGAAMGAALTAAELDAKLQANNLVLMAMIKAESVRRKNAQLFTLASDPDYVGNLNLIPLPKMIPGWGPGLPGVAAVAPHANPPPAVNARCPAPFPSDMNAFSSLTEDDLNTVSVWYNDDFDVVAVDDLDARRQKLKNFISFVC